MYGTHAIGTIHFQLRNRLVPKQHCRSPTKPFKLMAAIPIISIIIIIYTENA